MKATHKTKNGINAYVTYQDDEFMFGYVDSPACYCPMVWDKETGLDYHDDNNSHYYDLILTTKGEVI